MTEDLKTPEQMAEEWAHVPRADQNIDECDPTWCDVFHWEVESFLAGYQAAKPQWISVKERLPNLEKTSRSLRRESSCILLVSYGNVYVAHLCEDWTDRSHFIFEACTCNCRAFDMDIDEWKLDQVTHWMPLPEAPKEER